MVARPAFLRVEFLRWRRFRRKSKFLSSFRLLTYVENWPTANRYLIIEIMIASFNAGIWCMCGSLLLKHLNWIRNFLFRPDPVPKPVVCHVRRLLNHQRVLHYFALLVSPHRLFLQFKQVDGHIKWFWRQQTLTIEVILALPGKRVPHEFLKPLKLFLLFMLLDGLFARQFHVVGCLGAFRGVLARRAEGYRVLDYRVVSV